MARKPQRTHPSDEALLGVVDDEAPTGAEVREHLGACSRCARRVEELQATRRLLQEAATRRIPPPRDIAERAVGRLRLRQSAIGGMNEVVAAIRALIEGFALFFGGGPPATSPGSPPRHDEAGQDG